MNVSPGAPTSVSLPIASAEEADQTTRIVREGARAFGFCELEANMIASATSELSMNIVLHAERGTASFARTTNGRGLEVSFADDGPGIVDLERARTEGYSSRSDGLGLGLAAAAQAVHEFDIKSVPGTGTVATIRHYLPPEEGLFELGIASLADPAYACNGDAVHVCSVRGEQQLLAVIDGMGQGELAREAALCARKALEESSDLRLTEQAARVDEAILARGLDRGVVLALLLAGQDELRLVSVGDITCRVFDLADGSEPVHFAERPGILGTTLLIRLVEQRVELPANVGPLLVVLASDGVSPRFGMMHELTVSHPLDIAWELLRNFRRAQGDATVGVLRIAR